MEERSGRSLTCELPKGLVRWYGFETGARALAVTDERESSQALAQALEESGLVVERLSRQEIEAQESGERGAAYQYIVMSGGLERSRSPERLLARLRDMLTTEGRLLLGADNRLGVRYFCGDRDPFTGRNFDGIENYTKVAASERAGMCGRLYARAELIQMLEKAGFIHHRFYSVLPALERPQALYAQDYLPQEALDVRIVPQYNSPETVFLQEEGLYDSLMENGLFHSMANAYLIECPLDGCFSNVLQVTVSMDRGRRDSLATLIRRDHTVEKKPLYREGAGKMGELIAYQRDLERHGIKMIEAHLEGESYVMPYVEGEPATEYLRRLICTDKELFLREMDHFRDLVIGSSEHVPYAEVDWENFDPAWQNGEGQDIPRDRWRREALEAEDGAEDMGIILRRGYPDLVSLNCFYTDGEFVFYDQEFCVPCLPANAVLMRTIDFIYWGMQDGDWKKGEANGSLEALMPRRLLEERYHLTRHKALWHAFSDYFIYSLVNGRELSGYHRLCRRDKAIVEENRYRMNYAERDYRRFQDIFRDTKGREIYLFGSGSYAGRFLERFEARHGIAGIVDNNREKWGKEAFGIPILPPGHLQSLKEGSYKVIICIRKCIPVMRQLEEMGIDAYSVYDDSLEGKRHAGW
jgi:hypothetical protein